MFFGGRPEFEFLFLLFFVTAATSVKAVFRGLFSPAAIENPGFGEAAIAATVVEGFEDR